MRLASLFLIITLISRMAAQCQTLEQTYELAEQMYERKEYNAAIETFKRVIFFDSTQQYAQKIYPQIAHSLAFQKRYAEAADYYELAYFNAAVDSLKPYYQLYRSKAFLLDKNFMLAQEELLSLDKLPAPLISNYQLLDGITNFSLENYEVAEKQLKNLTPDTTQLHLLFRKNERISKLNPRKAKNLSKFIPGLGQMYAGDVKNGLNSFLLMGGLVYLGVRSAATMPVWEAALSVAPWVQRYYMGGIEKAEKITIARKQQRRYHLYQEILKEIEKQQKSRS